ncbi:hypothetical protein N869_05825, partial [Cellulomonas bogoriensis 69B4 = DSM 16987]
MLALGAAREVPVVPDAPTARRWAVSELSDPVYHQQESLLDMFLRWLMEQLSQIELAASGMDPLVAALVVLGVVVVVVAVALVVAGPVRRARSAPRPGAVFVDDTRTADELRASATALAAQGR